MENLERIIPAKESVFLEGPKSRTYELGFAWKVFREFIKGFRTLHFVGPCITVFGSARFAEDHPHYQSAREFGRQIAEIRKSTRLNSSHQIISYAVFCLKKKNKPHAH